MKQQTILSETEEKALIEKAQAGDAKAESRLYRKFEPLIRGEARAAVDRSTIDVHRRRGHGNITLRNQVFGGPIRFGTRSSS